MTSPIWIEIYNLYIQQASPIHETPGVGVGIESDGKTMGSPKKRQRTGEKSTNSNKTSSTKDTVTLSELKLQELRVAWKKNI